MAGTGVECGGWVDGTALNVATTMYFFLYSGLYYYQKDLLELETPTVSPMFRTLGIESVNMRTDNLFELFGSKSEHLGDFRNSSLPVAAPPYDIIIIRIIMWSRSRGRFSSAKDRRKLNTY